MYRILLLGPQGSGKGTQAELLASKLAIPAISMGDLWRREIENNTQWGRAYATDYKGGILAPDDQTSELAARRINEPDALNGFVFDSYPRNLSQKDLSERFVQFTHVVALTISDFEAIKRLIGRLFCKKCRRNYHVVYNPPIYQYGEKWLCNEDKEELVVRDDDREDAIKARLKIYHQETEPLIAYYRNKGALIEVNAVQEIEKVHADIMQLLTS